MSYSMIYPLSSQILNEKRPVFEWSKEENADFYEVIIEKYCDNNFIEIIKKEVSVNFFLMPFDFEEGITHRIIVIAHCGDINVLPDNCKNGIVFMSYINSKEHRSNKGIDYSFSNFITEKVLNNYLNRAITMETFHCSPEVMRNNLRLLVNVGAKYISRSFGAFLVKKEFIDKFETVGSQIALMHKIDEDIVFEACIFETTSKNIDDIAVPSFVQKAFGESVKKRCFNHDKMRFEDGSMDNRFAPGLHAPDITRIETQMFFYFLACSFIDLGFEALHMGQTYMMSKNDLEFTCYDKLIHMIREYAKTHARRGYVFINSHNYIVPFINKKGEFLCDFVAEPASVFDLDKEPHLPCEEQPQEAEIRPNGPWARRFKGITPSGWKTDNLPTLAEFDNFMAPPDNLEKLMYPTGKADVPWGMDEISWFANQPQWYRKEFLQYYTKQMTEYNINSHFAFQVSRPIFSIKERKMTNYLATDKIYNENGFSDESIIRNLWVEMAKNK